MPARFPRAELARLDAVTEVEVETRSASGDPHRTVVWIVVGGEDVYLRSYHGPSARWYREALSGRPVGLVADGEAIRVAVEPVLEPHTIAAVSAGFERKYAGDPATPAMLRPEVLPTTVRLHPA